MGHIRGAEYYNDIFTRYKKYHSHYSESRYFEMWKRIIELIKTIPEPSILEVGCGTGQFAEFLKDQNLIDYKGFDFSVTALNLATGRNINDFIFFEGDAQTKTAYLKYDYNLIVALEVFEHTDDMKLLEQIESGKNIILSVPEFDDPAHIRYFPRIEQVTQQYEKYINIEVLEKFDRWFILKGVKK